MLKTLRCERIVKFGLLVEYILHQASRVARALNCHNDTAKSIKFFFGNLTLSHVFDYIPYNIPTSLVFQVSMDKKLIS